MNKIISATLCVVAGLSAVAGNADAPRFDPPFWWTGMHDKSLQIQIYAPGIRSSDVSLAPYPGVSIDSVARLDGSANYLFLYLNVSSQAEPGKLKIKLADGAGAKTYAYELRGRKQQKGAQGFSSADVLYMIMPDRFANGDTTNDLVPDMNFPVGATREDLNLRHGGDLKGIADHVDYLDSLGVTAVWLNPVLENDMPQGSYHGYATTDYYRVDPRFGSNSEYAALVDTLHAHGMKTVMDMIFNHSGSEHIWFRDRPSSDWYNLPGGYEQTNYRLSTVTDPYASDYDRTLSTDGWFVQEMPDLNQLNPHLMKYLVQNSIWWIEYAQIDGIRMDTYPYADRMAMAQWCDAVLDEYPDFNIVGECWFGDPAGVAAWQRGSSLVKEDEDTHLPAVMDFPLMIKSRGLAPYTEQTDPWNGLNKIYDHVALDYIYADPLNLLRFLDNHDTERVLLEVPDSLGSWKQAITLLLTLPGIPQIYYGTELLMAGDRKPGDGNVRRDMPGGWPGDTVNAFSRSGRTELQNEATDFLSALLRWRRASKAVAYGAMKHFMPSNGLYLYKRFTPDGDEVIVMLNGQNNPLTVDMSRYREVLNEGATYRDVISGETVVLLPDEETHTHKMTFTPRQIFILEPVDI